MKQLVDAGVTVLLGTDMPSFYKTTLSDEYLAAVEHAGLSIDDLQDVALNAVRESFLPDDVQQTMLTEFAGEYARLSAEHLQTA